MSQALPSEDASVGPGAYLPITAVVEHLEWGEFATDGRAAIVRLDACGGR